MKYQIYWNDNLMREFTDYDKAQNCFTWFNKFLLPNKLKFKITGITQ